jgi:hypothetical protein
MELIVLLKIKKMRTEMEYITLFKRFTYTFFTILLIILFTGFFCSRFFGKVKTGKLSHSPQKPLTELSGFKIRRYFSDPLVIELCYTVDARQMGSIDELIKQNVNINAKGKNNLTPLLWCFQFTLWHGLANVRNYHEMSPYSKVDPTTNIPTCTQMFVDDRIRCLERLMFYGADPNVKIIEENGDSPSIIIDMENGITLVHLAAPLYLTPDLKIDFNCLPLVLKYGGDPNIVYDEFHITPIFCACNPEFKPNNKSKIRKEYIQ